MTLQRLTAILTGKPAYLIISSGIVGMIYFYSDKTTSSLDASIMTFRDCQILKVIDGDSLNVSCKGRHLHLRLQYIDAPEIPQMPWGDEAKIALQQYLVKPVEVAIQGQDIYQRHLAVLKQEKTNINLALVAQGYARVYHRYQPPEDYKQAMKAAKSQRLGIWRTQGLQQNPQRWRRLSQ